MSDTIGRIAVPTVINSGQTFPLTTQYPFGFSVERPVIVHRFGSLDAKQEQRYYVGIGPRKFQFKHANLNWAETNQLKAFWESMQGPWKAFTYNVPNPGGSTTSVLVTFEQVPISFEYLRNAVQVGLNLIEVVDPTQAPNYIVNSTCLRFPSTALSTALLSEVQQIVPLVHIRVRESSVADIYLSDRRVTVGGQLYLPRLIGIGEPGSDVLISQDIKGTSDNVRFTFGNGDRVMTQLANDTDLKYAEIDLCLFHVNSGILLQLWKGVIQNFTCDGTPIFPVTCSDGFFQIMNQYPERQLSRQCWKTYDDGVNCPWTSRGRSAAAVTAAGGDPTSCDYYLESANGCQVHGMAPYFGGHQADPQGVVIKDDSTGFLGFGRNTVTATSIISDTVWGLALPEIWCNSGGNPLFAFLTTALMVDYRDESGYADSLGILGAGPLGGFTASMVVRNADGYRYVVAPMVDGYLWQGLKLDGNLNVTKYQPGMGLRYIRGNDPANPATDYFSLGQGSQTTTGGSLPANVTLRVAICAIDSNGLPSAPSNIAIIGTGAAAGGSFTLEGITWPAVAGLVSYVLFVATQDDLICAQATGALTAGPNNTYTPGSITFGGPLVRSTWALPSPYVGKVRLKAKHLIHGGIIGAPVDSVSTGALVVGYLKGSPPSSNPSFTPVGRIISIIGRPESATPYFSGTITSWDQTTGAIGVTPDPNGIVQAGDCLVVRYKADSSNSANPTSITDSGCQNIAYPAGMTPGAEIGNLVRVILGVSRGLPPRKIIANTATTITWDLPMVINPGDVWIIEEPTWPYSCDTTSLDNGNPLAVTTINMPTGNFVDEALVIAGFTVDVNGNESPDGDAPIREDWVFGAEGLSKVAGLVFQMQGTLGVESNAAQPLYLNRPVTVGDVKAYVQAAPTGSAITFTIYVGGAAWLSLTIPAGQTAVVASPSQIGGLSQIPANTAVSIGITAVGTTFPGANLSVFVYS